jgi:anti-sigma factor RsiW
MNNVTDIHPSADELLLFGYGELPEPRSAEVEVHVARCATCHAQVLELERGRVLADWALGTALRRRRRSVALWAGLTLAAAAVLAAVLIGRPGSSRGADDGWRPTTTWSATAGYVAGGKAMVEIDAQLTRLEQEKSYGRP